MPDPIPLFPQSTSRAESIRRLQELMADERFVGVAFVAIMSDDDHQADVVGEARKSPIFVRGLLLDLIDLVRQLDPPR